MSFRMREYVIKKESIFAIIHSSLSSFARYCSVWKRKKKKSRCLTKKKYSLEFYFMLHKVKEWGLRSFNAKHEKNLKVS